MPKNIFGTNLDDTFSFSDNSVSVNGGSPDVIDQDVNVLGKGGSDTADFSGMTHSVTVDLDTGIASTFPFGVHMASVENVIGTSYNDSVKGSSTAENTLYGMNGDDHLAGRDLADQLFGGAGKDGLTGNGGDDLINGGAGVDQLVGNAGADTFAFGLGDSGLWTPNSSSQADALKDFVSGTDHIQLNDGLVYTGSTLLQTASVAHFVGSAGQQDVVMSNFHQQLTSSDFI